MCCRVHAVWPHTMRPRTLHQQRGCVGAALPSCASHVDVDGAASPDMALRSLAAFTARCSLLRGILDPHALLSPQLRHPTMDRQAAVDPIPTPVAPYGLSPAPPSLPIALTWPPVGPSRMFAFRTSAVSRLRPSISSTLAARRTAHLGPCRHAVMVCPQVWTMQAAARRTDPPRGAKAECSFIRAWALSPCSLLAAVRP